MFGGLKLPTRCNYTIDSKAARFSSRLGRNRLLLRVIALLVTPLSNSAATEAAGDGKNNTATSPLLPSISAPPHSPQNRSSVPRRPHSIFGLLTPEHVDVSADNKLSVTHKNRGRNVKFQTYLAADYQPVEATGSAANTNSATSGEHEFQINSFYVSATDPDKALSAQFGRQLFEMVDTPYQFDGVALSYQLLKQQRVKMAVGYPQSGDSPADVDTNKFFYGISAETERFADHWQADVYAFEHSDTGVTQRQIMGSKLNYLHPKYSATLDLSLNPEDNGASSAYTMFNWHPRDHYGVKLALDYRKPSARKEHAISALGKLLDSLSDEETASLDQDRGAEFHSGTLSWTQKLSTRLAMNGETSVAALYNSPLAGNPRLDTHRLYSLQLSGNGLFKSDDTSAVSLHYLQFGKGDRISFVMNNNTPFRSFWSTDFKLETDWEKNTDRTETLSLGPLFKLQYNRKNKTKLDFEIGAKYTESLSGSKENLENDYFFSITHSREF